MCYSLLYWWSSIFLCNINLIATLWCVHTCTQSLSSLFLLFSVFSRFYLSISAQTNMLVLVCTGSYYKPNRFYPPLGQQAALPKELEAPKPFSTVPESHTHRSKWNSTSAMCYFVLHSFPLTFPKYIIIYWQSWTVHDRNELINRQK